MAELEFCPACEWKKKEEGKDAGQSQKEDRYEKIKLALRKAEKCKYFHHHHLFDADGKPDSHPGARTCSLSVSARCGHEVLKHVLCTDWRDGKDCPDWEEKKEQPGS